MGVKKKDEIIFQKVVRTAGKDDMDQLSVSEPKNPRSASMMAELV